MGFEKYHSFGIDNLKDSQFVNSLKSRLQSRTLDSNNQFRGRHYLVPMNEAVILGQIKLVQPHGSEYDSHRHMHT